MAHQQSIDSTEALFRKLKRTFDRRQAYGDYQVDWVFDLAITAWHLVDWVARERSVGSKLNVLTTQEQLKGKCPELAVCEQVCNGAKHLVLDNPQLKPFDVTVNVKGTNDLIGIKRTVVAGEGSIDIILTPSVSIIDKDGQIWQATMLFNKILSFWQKELGLPQS